MSGDKVISKYGELRYRGIDINESWRYWSNQPKLPYRLDRVILFLHYVSYIKKHLNRYGELRYRGIDINELVNGFVSEERLGFEEVSYLLLFGTLPTEVEC
jgi:citrate synthase